MIVLTGGIDSKADDDVVQETVLAIRLSLVIEIFTDVEYKLVFARSEIVAFNHRCIAATV